MISSFIETFAEIYTIRAILERSYVEAVSPIHKAFSIYLFHDKSGNFPQADYYKYYVEWEGFAVVYHSWETPTSFGLDWQFLNKVNAYFDKEKEEGRAKKPNPYTPGFDLFV